MNSLHGYEVVSELPLQRLSASAGDRGRIEIASAPERLLDRAGELTAWHELRGIEFALARADGHMLAWCSRTGAFEIDPAAGRVRVSEASLDEAWEHRVGTTAVPLLAAERDDLAIHASAVAVDGRGVLLCGPSGRGKSTLALMSARLGHRVVTEDGAVVALGGHAPLVWPGARGVRVDDRAADAAGLAPSGGNGRGGLGLRRLRTVGLQLEASGPVPVTAVCQLTERGPRLEVTRLAAAQALPGLAPSLIHAGGADSLRPAFARLATLVESVAVFRVTMPDRLDGLGDATQSLLARVA